MINNSDENFDCYFEVLEDISFVTSNRKLKNFILNYLSDNITLKEKKVEDYNKSFYVFANDKERISIDIFDNQIYVSVNDEDSIIELTYKKNMEGISINYSSILSIDSFNRFGKKYIEEFVLYDKNGKLIFNKSNEISKMYNSDGSIIKNMSLNYSRSIYDSIVNDKMFRIEKNSFSFDKLLNNEKYYICEYEPGMFCSECDKRNFVPKYVPFYGKVDEYIFEIEKKDNKNEKIMI